MENKYDLIDIQFWTKEYSASNVMRQTEIAVRVFGDIAGCITKGQYEGVNQIFKFEEFYNEFNDVLKTSPIYGYDCATGKCMITSYPDIYKFMDSNYSRRYLEQSVEDSFSYLTPKITDMIIGYGKSEYTSNTLGYHLNRDCLMYDILYFLFRHTLRTAIWFVFVRKWIREGIYELGKPVDTGTKAMMATTLMEIEKKIAEYTPLNKSLIIVFNSMVHYGTNKDIESFLLKYGVKNKSPEFNKFKEANIKIPYPIYYNSMLFAI